MPLVITIYIQVNFKDRFPHNVSGVSDTSLHSLDRPPPKLRVLMINFGQATRAVFIKVYLEHHRSLLGNRDENEIQA